MPDTTVREFHQILLWPLQLRRINRDTGFTAYWDILKKSPGAWKKVADPLLIEDESCEVGYEEFVYFLPYVQRFLYGVGEDGKAAQASMHIFRRDDIANIRVTLHADQAPLELDVGRLRLYLFNDVDIAIVAFEVFGYDIPLEQAVELLDRFGRPYPPAWESASRGAHCTDAVSFLDASGRVLASSDYGDRARYQGLVRDARQTPLATHWEFLLQPLVPNYKKGGVIKYFQIENKRIPLMSYLSFDEPRDLTRGDMIRIGSAAKWGPSDTLPYAESFLASFERVNCYDRYWDAERSDIGMNTRYIFAGLSFAMITKYSDDRRDLKRHFRHPFYQVGLIAHFHKAALLSFSNRFSRAVERLDVYNVESVKDFKRNVRQALEVFLRFNHRYWFHEISNQVQASDFFLKWRQELGTDHIYREVREEAHDINQYLDNDRMRKQADSTMRLTVVSACGMVGTIVTGFLGMNIFSYADQSQWSKFAIFFAVFVPTTLLALFTVVLSRRISDFMEAMASENLSWRDKFDRFGQIWRYGRRKQKVTAGFDAASSGD
ncbi:MAG: hypothetical protein JNM76_15035 [Betaproteobacteria bacterium]|nr:hypothetical protein [Betaproteobacteria bacterium]